MVGFDGPGMAGEALKRLFDLGHRDVFLPLASNTPGFVSRVHAILQREHESRGIPYLEGWNSPVAENYSPERLAELLLARLERKRPDAVMAFGWGIRVVIGVLLQRGIRVPEDVSLVLLGNERGTDWFWPRMTSFHYNWKGVLNYIGRWLDREAGAPPPESQRIMPEWREGATVKGVGRKR